MQEGQDYRDLRATVSISFLDSVRYRQVSAYRHRFELMDPRTQLAMTDDLAIHLVELPKFDLRPEQLSSPFEVWCYFLRHGETLDTASLPTALDTPIFHRCLEVMNVLTQNDRERELYEGRLKARRDQAALVHDVVQALQEGREEGHKEGLKEGREKGMLIGRIQAYEELLGRPPSSAADLQALSLEQLAERVDQLRAQLSRPSS
jgi:predicted transposase/invertase (TIGR01784 family)